MIQGVVIDRRFRGPPRSANGGYACGVIAAGIEGVATVTLRIPPPLDKALTFSSDGERSLLLDGDDVVGEATSGSVEARVPPPPSYEAAEEASRHYVGFESHPFESCFVCGPAREPGDGLRVFPGVVGGLDLVAAPWIPDQSLLGGNGRVDRRYVWAVLDCPSYFGLATRPLALLGRLTADIQRIPEVGEPMVAMGWHDHSEGRKHFCGSALATAKGEVIARAQAVWIEVRELPPGVR